MLGYERFGPESGAITCADLGLAELGRFGVYIFLGLGVYGLGVWGCWDPNSLIEVYNGRIWVYQGLIRGIWTPTPPSPTPPQVPVI